MSDGLQNLVEAYDREAERVHGPELTEPQARLLDRVREEGKLVLNNRARRPLEKLEALGLVDVDWDADLDATKGRLRWRITVTLPHHAWPVTLTRDVTRAECDWLPRRYLAGERLYTYGQATYGVVGPGFVALTALPDEWPFHGFPEDAVKREGRDAR